MYIFRFQLGFNRNGSSGLNAVLYSAVQHCTALYSTVQNSVQTRELRVTLWCWTLDVYYIYVIPTSQLNSVNKYGNLNSILKHNSSTLGLIMVACCTLGPGSHSKVVCRQCGRAGLYSPLS